MKRLLFLLLFLSLPVGAQPRRALIHAVVHSVAQEAPMPDATVVFSLGKIVSVTTAPAPSDCQVVDARGLHLYPSLIDADTILGLSEIASERATHDYHEIGDLNPDLKAELAFNVDSEVVRATASAGILVAGVMPQGGLLSGQGAVMKLWGRTWEDMTVLAGACLCMEWPSANLNRLPDAQPPLAEQVKHRRQRLEKLADAFHNARAYQKGARGAQDLFWEALLPVLERRRPLLVRAHNLDQIEEALHWGRQEQIRLVLVDAEDAWRVADRLAQQQVGVIYSGVLKLPRRDHESSDAYLKAPEEMRRRGVRVALSGGDDVANVRWLTQAAGLAVAFGMSRHHALESITRVPAQLLGVEDRLGTLESGKDATFFLASGDILDGRTQVLRAWVDGQEIDLQDRQKKLYQRYR